MKKLDNIRLIKNRIQKVAINAPKDPLKGRGHNRLEIHLPRVFELLKKLAPQHCETVSNREAVNQYGKLGFVGHHYVSPELFSVVFANADDFAALEKALKLVEDFAI